MFLAFPAEKSWKVAPTIRNLHLAECYDSLDQGVVRGHGHGGIADKRARLRCAAFGFDQDFEDDSFLPGAVAAEFSSNWKRWQFLRDDKDGWSGRLWDPLSR